jgi:hypothetical protein
MRPSANLWREAQSILLRHCEEDRLYMSVMPGLHLMRFGWRSVPLVAKYGPCMALVLQGTKSVEFGEKHLKYGAGQYLLASMDLPATSRIVNASKTHPLLAVAVDIDFAELKEVIERCDALPPSSSQSGMTVFEAAAELLNSVVRLLRLLDTPQHARPLAPLARQGILYRLLSGLQAPGCWSSAGTAARQTALPRRPLGFETTLQRVSWSGNWLITWA